ncbi:MAG: hypothetical protein IKO27_00360 [Ruminococcus sp.]|nr:hypothetical protein [Ruminococcus sp.]
MLMVVFCYTLCALNDKYAVSRAKLDRSELMFLMAAGTSVFLLFVLPFMETDFVWSWKILIPIALITLCKYTEFSVLPAILDGMSPFRLKSWVGLTLFMSYFTDVFFYGTALSAAGLIFVAVTFAGLALAAKADGRSTNYRRIWFRLLLYIVSKFGYGLAMRTTVHIFPNVLTLLAALIILVLISLPRISFKRMLAKPEGKKGVIIVLAAKLPNTLGLLGENYTAARSLSNYSFIQPLILISLFVLAIADRKSKLPPPALIGGAVTVAGIVGFQIFK